jgi:RimJ/RimL family protein N-acetyltransferase
MARLHLRGLCATDADAVRIHWDRNSVRKYLFSGERVNHWQVVQLLQAAEADAQRLGIGLFGIYMNEEPGRLRGVVGVLALGREFDREPMDPDRAEGLISLDPVLWGEGLAWEAAEQFAELARRRGLGEVWVRTSPGNPAGERLAQRVKGITLHLLRAEAEDLVRD